MTRRGVVSALALAASATLWGARESGAQSLEQRIGSVRDGRIRLTFAAALGVCGNGNNWSRTRNGGSVAQMSGVFYDGGSRDVENTCERGPVRLVVVREQGDTKQLRTYVGGRWKADTGITDLGAISAREVGAWLLAQAERGPDRVARSALQAAILGDSIATGPILLRIARDDSRPQDVRNSAVNWLGEVVGERVSATLDSIAYEPGDRELRRAAIFALARRPADEAIPALQKLAESLPDRELRRSAVMALAQTRDPRALQWIEGRLGSR
ncbi:MAG: HEAT repeat domain-containing protein [Gemmatimonadaceae bacterium]|nr:HEAT repeat domain-containing protein [Gemmatimonadaceae bacterium]